MLRVTTLYASSAAASAAYYTQYLTQAVGEAPGVWSGAQADRFGVDGVVSAGALQALLEGRDPTTGTRLGQPLVDRRRTDDKVVKAVAGFDATFSSPKSVSVLWALTGDDRILAVHDHAVGVALAHLERYGATTRIRVNGARPHPDTRRLTMAMFRQSTSRRDARRARCRVGPVVHGQAEIAGVPAELLAVFSKRTVQVEVRAPHRGRSVGGAASLVARSRIEPTFDAGADRRTRRDTR
jgi:TrwC relaxase